MYGNTYTSGFAIRGGAVRGNYGGVTAGLDGALGSLWGGDFRLGFAIHGGGGKALDHHAQHHGQARQPIGHVPAAGADALAYQSGGGVADAEAGHIAQGLGGDGEGIGGNGHVA